MSKKAQDSCQIRDSCIWKGKIKFLRIFDLVLLENICTINEQSFFTPFAIQFSSINTQHHSQPLTRNPSQRTSPYFVKIFQETLKNRIPNCSSFQDNPAIQTSPRDS